MSPPTVNDNKNMSGRIKIWTCIIIISTSNRRLPLLPSTKMLSSSINLIFHGYVIPGQICRQTEQSSLTLSYTESSKRLQRDQHKPWLKFWCGKNTCKATTWYMQFLKLHHYCKVTWCRHILMHCHIHKELQDTVIWTWPSSKGQKGQTKVNIELVGDFDGENISVKLWNDTVNILTELSCSQGCLTLS